MAEHTATFANFICRFGTKNLLDYAEEIVMPALTDPSLRRDYSSTSYFITSARILELGRDEDVLAVAGRFVKDTMLKRTQVYKQGVGLVHDEASIESAPSAYFVLILNNHKLIYVPETPSPPDLSSFRATVSRFLREKHKEFVDVEYSRLKEQSEKVTKKRLYEVHPRPVLNIVALEASIDDFVRRYETLELLEFRLLRPNQEAQGRALWRGMQGLRASIDSDRTTLSHRSPRSRGGLDKPAAVTQIHDAAAAGNQIVNMRGRDAEGSVLRGNNESFKVQIPVAELPDDPAERALALYQQFEDLVAEGYLRLDRMAENVKGRIARLKEILL